MRDSTACEILDQLDEGQIKLLQLSAALPKWVDNEYDLDSGDVAELIEHSRNSGPSRN